MPKSSKKAPKIDQYFLLLGVRFRPLSLKCGHRKIGCFSDSAFSAQNRTRAPQSEHHSRSGAQKVAKMEPKMMTFWGPAEKLKCEPGLGESTVEAVPGGSRIIQNSMLFLKALPEAHFSGPGGPKRRPSQILGRIWPILGPHLSLLLAKFCILGGLNFSLFLGHFWGA